MWLAENPHAYIDKGLHPEKIGVWWAVIQKQIVGPILFEEIVDSDIYYFIIS